MDKIAISAMLTFASTLDYRLNNEPDTVEAWALVLDENMNQHWAAKFVRTHYKRSQTVLTPSMINQAWQEHQSLLAGNGTGELDAHCGMTGCMCSHVAPCYRGWIDNEGVAFTSPCPVCRGSLSQLLDELPPLGFRTQADESRIRNRFKDL